MLHSSQVLDMRGRKFTQTALFSTRQLNQWVPKNHRIRKLRLLVDHCLHEMDSVFEGMYDSGRGRESIAPEQLIRALVLQTLFSIRSERQLIEHLDYNMLYRWFVGLEIDARVWHHSTFSANRERLLKHEVIRGFFERVVEVAESLQLVSVEHFSVDGTLIQAFGAMKRFVKRDSSVVAEKSAASACEKPTVEAEKSSDHDASATAIEVITVETPLVTPTPEAETEPQAPAEPRPGKNPDVDFRGEKRVNATHFCETDPEALSYRKGDNQAAQLSVMGHALMENRHGLIVDAQLTQATGTCERDSALQMAERSIWHPDATLGADKAYDTKAYVEALENSGVSAHSAQNNKGRQSWISDTRAQTEGYKQSIRKRKQIEEYFGWVKSVAMLRKSRFVGIKRTAMAYMLSAAGYNLVRMVNLIGGYFKPLQESCVL